MRCVCLIRGKLTLSFPFWLRVKLKTDSPCIRSWVVMSSLIPSTGTRSMFPTSSHSLVVHPVMCARILSLRSWSCLSLKPSIALRHWGWIIVTATWAGCIEATIMSVVLSALTRVELRCRQVTAISRLATLFSENAFSNYCLISGRHHLINTNVFHS